MAEHTTNAERLAAARILSVTVAAPGWNVAVGASNPIAYPIAAWGLIEYPDGTAVEPMFHMDAADGSLTHGFRIATEEDTVVFTYGPGTSPEGDVDMNWVDRTV